MELKCSKCGQSNLIKENEHYRCPVCESIIFNDDYKRYEETIERLIQEGKEADIGELRNSFNKELEQEHLDVSQLKNICNDIKRIISDDKIANYFIRFLDRNRYPRNYESFLKTLCSENLSKYEQDQIIPVIIKSCNIGTKEVIEELLKAHSLYTQENKENIERALKEREEEIDKYYTEKDVFVCHSSKDKEEIVKIVNALEDNGLTCWYSGRNLPWDIENYWEGIHKAIKDCRVFLFVLSKYSRVSKDVIHELDYARSLNKQIRVEYRIDESETNIPIKMCFDGIQWIDGSKTPKYEELAERIYNCIEVNKAYENDNIDDALNLSKKIEELNYHAVKDGIICGVCGKPFKIKPSEYVKGDFVKYCSNKNCPSKKTNPYYIINAMQEKKFRENQEKLEDKKKKLPYSVIKLPDFEKMSFQHFDTPSKKPSYEGGAHSFNTLLLDEDLFREKEFYFLEDRKKYIFDYFNKFYMMTYLSYRPVEADHKNIYTLVLRILNRGLIIPFYGKFKEKLKEKFNKETEGDLKSILDYVKKFPMSLKVNKKELAEILKDDSPYPINFDNKYIFSVKIFHQIQVSIIKALEQGYINNNTYISIKNDILIKNDASSFTNEEMEYIFNLAIEDLNEIVTNLSELYEVNLRLNFKNDMTDPITFIYGNITRYPNSINICEWYSEDNFLCELAPFDKPIFPKNIRLKNIEYFLHYIFGYKELRDGQFEAIKRLLTRKDSIVLLPTGAGKSIIYQLSSFLITGMIVVISPLKSLIIDQVTNLKSKHGITTAIPLYHSNIKEERGYAKKCLEVMKHNNVSLLYISPERLQIPSFRNNIQSMKSTNFVFSIAIDEAHCVSEWGHEFRHSYLNIATVSRNLLSRDGVVPSIIGLTGTASDAVLQDVKRDLKIYDEDAIISPRTFDREELNFSIYKCSSEEKVQTIADIIKNKLPEKFDMTFEKFSLTNQGDSTMSGLVFTPLADEETKYMYSALQMRHKLTEELPSLQIKCYFSKKPKQFEKLTWEGMIKGASQSFKNNKTNLLVCTKAYGMGIDKGNIRYTIHDGIPSSLEQFYQEAGRAGRDQNPSECIIVFSDDNSDKNDELLSASSSLKQVNEYVEHNRFGTSDDLSQVLFFHSHAYKGIEDELRKIKELVDVIKEKERSQDNKVSVYIEKNVETDKEKETIQSIIRLCVLGIIKDYTYDYAGHFEIALNEFDRTTISKNYISYVSDNNQGRAKAAKSEIEKINKEGWDLVLEACKVLITYIYTNIEESRRRAIRTMYMTAKEASNVPENEQNEFIKSKVLSYFSIQEEERDIITSIEKAPNCGLSIVNKHLKLDEKSITIPKNIEKQARKVILPIERKLESVPDHTGLLFFLAINEMIAYKDDEQRFGSIIDNILLGYKNGKERYQISEAKLNDSLFKICNLVLNTSYELFDLLIKNYSKSIGKKKELLSDLIERNYISEEHKDYLLLLYVNDVIKVI